MRKHRSNTIIKNFAKESGFIRGTGSYGTILDKTVFFYPLPDTRHLILVQNQNPLSYEAWISSRQNIDADEKIIEKVEPGHIKLFRKLMDGGPLSEVKQALNKQKPITRKKMIADILRYLDHHGFKKTRDLNFSYSKNAPCYYKKLKDGRYLVFVHLCSKRATSLQCFDPIILTLRGKPNKEFGKSEIEETEFLMLDYIPMQHQKAIDNLLEGKEVNLP